ncbi:MULTISPECIES: AAA family ATPase [Actinomadura]|uniref:AAA family ATPase n=1 Tax=Actinomadura yumaensis TaxID=111807 RepID=A0ABW2CSM6_9ACTN|nr:MoxR family ATPase [Actinomadura sp. J1-007]MWK36658.1 AAA domain-containing protein [Actinomadura sp. J1-007]
MTPGSAPDGQGRDWRVYRGDGTPHDGIADLPPPPPWRRFDPAEPGDPARARRLGDLERAASYRADEQVVDKVNAALQLRRPLLVTGKPGSGKSTLAYNIAYELRLGPVLYWPVSSRTTLEQGLYDYDAIGRVHETSLRRSAPGAGGGAEPAGVPDIGRYVRLGPLGTALLPAERPRVLLIDELDKSDIDLPNDLLNVLEEGRFAIPELARLPADQDEVEVMTAGDGRAVIRRGLVRCSTFPIVVITSNGEREFPLAFLRRCVRAAIEPPSRERLADIVEAHLGAGARAAGEEIIREFLDRRAQGDLATDQLLNAIFLATSGSRPPETTLAELVEAILRPLDVTRPA